MNTIELSILTLVARESLSGYDIKLQMNDRISQFVKVSNNQIYPQIKKLEVEQLIRLREITKSVQHPEKKIYEITDAGLTKLKEISANDFGDPVIKDGFLVKMYNSWLFTPEETLAQIANERMRHIERVAVLNEKVTKLSVQSEADEKLDFSSLAVLEYGLMFENNYLQWLDKMTNDLEQGN